MTAFLNIGGPEMVVLLIVGLLVFGRDLPAVGAKIGRTVAQLRRGLHDFKAQMDSDEDFREARSTMREAKDAVRGMEAPRYPKSPRQVFDALTDESLATPATEEPRRENGEAPVADGEGHAEPDEGAREATKDGAD